MGQKANDDVLKQLCELASHEHDHQKLMALTAEIIAVLDAKQGKLSAALQPKK